MKLLLATLALALALGATFFLWSDADRTLPLESAPHETHLPSATSTKLAAASQSSRRESTQTERIFGEPTSQLTPADIEALPTELTLAGRVLIKERDGSETRALTGRVHFTTWLEGRANGHVVQIERGRFRLSFARQADGTYASPDGSLNEASLRDARIKISELFLYDPYGKTSAPNTNREFTFGTEDVSLHVNRVSSLTIRAEDAQTGAALESVTIRHYRSINPLEQGPRDDPWNPVAAIEGRYNQSGEPIRGILVSKASSPIRLTTDQREAQSEGTDFWVGSPTYAWTRMSLDLNSDGERVVRLEQAAGVAVTLSGTPPEQRRFLRIREGTPPQLLTTLELTDEDQLPVNGLPAGNYTLQLETGGGWEAAQIWAHAKLELSPGSTEQVALVWQPVPEQPKSALSGTLFLPETYELDWFTLTIRPLDGQGSGSFWPRHLREYELLKIGTDTYAFQFDGLETGRYQLSFPRLKYAIELMLPTQGIDDLRFEIPPLAEIRVRLMDKGSIADVMNLQWTAVGPSQVQISPVLFPPVGTTVGTHRQRGEDFFRLWVPQGEILITHLEPFGVDYVVPKERLLARPGGEYTLHLERACSAELVLLDGETRVPWPRADTQQPATENGMLRAYRGEQGLGRVRSDTPGRRAIAIPSLPGFEPHVPVEIEFRHGETPRVELRLVRER